ncbi:methyltransferase domain-containing protein [Roseiarcaceae bacterium H3SJ34-1]|uniref:methyltransferase domain-containing protein n=1 Tax=Terripilifer ovatus TaxID=3032367 RepID=UPI003AB94015|nr:methyltransferase domain-containing protein [Roseiarcaceae bacterium H3SJ34-1]
MNTAPQPPQIFDRPLVVARLRRALQQGPAAFLLERAVEDFSDRLDAILRPFPRALDLGTPGPQLADLLSRNPERHVVRAAPIAETAGSGRFETLVCDAEALPFAPASFDLAVSALALQWVNDLPGTLIQIRRALAPDGLFLACMAGGQTLTELRAALAEAEEEIAGGASPRVAPFADIRDLGALLQRAGFALPVTDTDTLTVRYPHIFALMQDLRAMGAANALTQRLKHPTRRAVFIRAAEIYQERFADADGRIRASFELVWLSGWAPHESQQKPLQPGSARMRLADALKTRETRLE